MKMVFDASTLILLAKTDLLRETAEDITIIISEKVKAECLVKKSLDAILISTLIGEKKIKTMKVENRAAVNKIKRDFRIETGEAETLWLAGTLGCPIAVDDGPTIKACKVLGREFATAIHFLLDIASRNKLELQMAFEKLYKLSAYGRYSSRIIDDAARRLKGGVV